MFKSLAIIGLLATCSLIEAAPQKGETVEGVVVSIADGDTLTLLTSDKQQVKVRLSEIDTPESSQPYGKSAKELLSRLVFGFTVQAKLSDIDRYNRFVGRVSVAGIDVNAAMVEQGAAWVYRQYSHDPQLLELEAKARSASRGLWKLPEDQRVPPWEECLAKVCVCVCVCVGSPFNPALNGRFIATGCNYLLTK